MKYPSLRRMLSLALACAAVPALAPAAASASTWTVDDDKAQCPGAGFTSIQAAVDQAAPWDTIVVCDGLYEEQSTPPNNPTQNPAQAGSRNGLTITKPLTIRGVGASKVRIRPAAALGTTLAGTAPYLRDGGGNVVTISRQSLGSTDANENFVDISGVTIDSPNAAVEAGVAFFNTSGRISNSMVGPLLRATDAPSLAAAPHGWGIIMTNSLQGSEAGVRREVTVANSLVTGYQSGGILFDDGRGADGSATTTQRSGITEYGYVTGTRVLGSGASTLIPQTGVRYANGARGSVTGSEIANNAFTTDLRQSVGLLLTDVASGTDPQDPSRPAFAASTTSFTGNGYAAFNANATNDAVRDAAPATVGGTGANASWFGCTAGPLVGSPSSFSGPTNGCQGLSGADSAAAPSVDAGTPRTAAPPALSVPGAVVDAKPTGAFMTGDFTVVPGGTIAPVVAASDDFGVKRVVLLLGGTAIASKTVAPYELAPTWTPAPEDAGKSYELVARVTDSSGQTTTTAPTTVTVAGPAFAPLIVSAGSWDAGALTLGAAATTTVTLTNHSAKPLKLTSVGIDGAGFAVDGGTCAAGDVLAAGATCTVGVRFAPTAAGAVTGQLSVGSTADDAPVVVALEGAGVAPPVVTPPVVTPPVVTPPVVTPPVVTPPAPLVAVLPKSVKASSSGLVGLGRFTCAAACRLTITGTLKLGSKHDKITLTRTLKAARATTITLKLTASQRAALKQYRKGTLSLKITAGTAKKSATIKITH